MFRGYKYSSIVICVLIALYSQELNLFSIETQDEWLQERAPVKYTLIKSGQEPQELGTFRREQPAGETAAAASIVTEPKDRLEEVAQVDEGTRRWHAQVQAKFWEVSSRADAGSTNFVQIRVIARYDGGEERALCLPHVFLSGGRLTPEKEPLVREFGPQRVRFMDDVFPSEKTGAAKGREYKDSLVNFFQLSPLDSGVPKDDHVPPGLFNFTSNLRVLKYFKQPADVLFQNSNFIYEFYDAEQVARQFMIRSAKKGRPIPEQRKECEERLDALRKLATANALKPEDPVSTFLEKECRKAEKIYEDFQLDWGHLFPSPALSSGETVLNALISQLKGLRAVQIQIATHGHVCHSCRGTYWYELEAGHELERSILFALSNEAEQIMRDPTHPSAVPEGGAKKKAKANPLEELVEKIRNDQKSKDPRSQFFPNCQFSVLVSSSKTKSKEARVEVPLSALLREGTVPSVPEEWWKDGK